MKSEWRSLLMASYSTGPPRTTECCSPHDAKTIPPTHYARMARGLPVPLLIVVPQSMPIGSAAEDLFIVLSASTLNDWAANYIRLPLR